MTFIINISTLKYPKQKVGKNLAISHFQKIKTLI